MKRLTIWRWVVFTCRIPSVLPIAVLGLIDRKPLVNVGIIPCNDELGVVEEVIHDAAVSPGTVLIEYGERSVPVEKRYRWMNAILVHGSDHVVVVRNGLLINRAMSKGKKARP